MREMRSSGMLRKIIAKTLSVIGPAATAADAGQTPPSGNDRLHSRGSSEPPPVRPLRSPFPHTDSDVLERMRLSAKKGRLPAAPGPDKNKKAR